MSDLVPSNVVSLTLRGHSITDIAKMTKSSVPAVVESYKKGLAEAAKDLVLSDDEVAIQELVQLSVLKSEVLKSIESMSSCISVDTDAMSAEEYSKFVLANTAQVDTKLKLVKTFMSLAARTSELHGSPKLPKSRSNRPIEDILKDL